MTLNQATNGANSSPLNSFGIYQASAPADTKTTLGTRP